MVRVGCQRGRNRLRDPPADTADTAIGGSAIAPRLGMGHDVEPVRRMLRTGWMMMTVACSLSGWAIEPAAIFAKNCGPCHGKDGKARTPIARKLGVKDLTQSKISDDEIRRQIREGRKDRAGKLQMPEFKDTLSDEEIKLLIGYVKTLRK